MTLPHDRMRTSRAALRVAGALLGLAGLGLGGLSPLHAATARSAAPPPVLPVEDSDTATLARPGAHWLWLFDPYRAQGAVVLDGDDPAMKTMALVPAARNAGMSLSRDGGKVYVAETYWSRGNRGTREDLFTVYDGATLKVDEEVVLPGRLLVVPKTQQQATSFDGKLGYIYDMVPSSAIHVVDIASGKPVASIDVPGCALAFPIGARRVATLCGDGSIGVADVPASGDPTVAFSDPFFDPDSDPVFENSFVDRDTGKGWMLSFSGKVYPVELGGAKPVVGQPWSIEVAAGQPEAGTGVQQLAWRPGGGQLLAVHRARHWLYVLMHKGNYWTHKEDGSEVWVFNADTHALVRRIRLETPAHGIAVTQDEAPLLFAFGGGRGTSLIAYDALSGKPMRHGALSGMIGLVTGL